VETVDTTELLEQNDEISCDPVGSVFRPGRHIFAMPQQDAATLEDCRQAKQVITPYAVCHCATTQVIDDPVL
jgi:hypothetical protein